MNIFKLASSTLLLSSAIAITGCGSDGDSGTSTSAAAVPKDAIILDATNTQTIVEKAFTATDIILSKGVQQTAAANSVISQVVDTIRNNAINSGVDLVTGIAFSDTYDCSDPTGNTPGIEGAPNTYTDKGNATINGSSFTANGTATFTECAQLGVILDGSVSFNFTEDDATLEWSSKVTGNLTMTVTVVPIAITNLAINDAGNFGTGDYVTSKMQYTYNPGTGGFALNMTTNIEGNDYDCGPTAGVVEISGANNTKARITFNADMSMTVEINTGDGTYTELTAFSPILCLT